MKHARALCWFRRDLRLSDHSAFALATQESQSVIPVFIFDPSILKILKNKKHLRLNFLHASLVELQENLKKQGSDLLVRVGDPFDEIKWIIEKLKIDALYFNTDYEPYAKIRDAKMHTLGIPIRSVKDSVIFESREILNTSAEPFKVFTSYKNHWLKKLNSENYIEYKPQLEVLAPENDFVSLSQNWNIETLGFKKIPLDFEPGEFAGQNTLREFKKHISKYDQLRNFPSQNGTSKLSPHLRFGTLSIREAVRFSKQGKSLGHQSWLNELIWRDFYQMILDQFPHIQTQSFKPKYDRIEWSQNQEHFQAWCEGHTGYPIVDAAMRQLNQTGWMHNRLRMIVASFLTKDLQIDWRKGEQYFSEKLIDYDLAANNGGWQWSASTGTDAQPYFRIFNPTEQSKRFDPEGLFIRKFIPELKDLDSRSIHEAFQKNSEKGRSLSKNYPSPIVNHALARKKALQMFQKIAK